MNRFTSLVHSWNKTAVRQNLSRSQTRSMNTNAESSVIVLEKAHSRTVILNRPKALNALNLDMCTTIKRLHQSWSDPASKVGLFVVKGSGEKAFCAGGDVRSIWQKIHEKKSINEICEFFKVEYQMNYMLATSSIPQVSIWNGIVMGGGVGVSRLGEFRVTTERAMFAMPETAIGLFPDVGSSHWLPHIPDGLGEYIGLTGVRLGAADLVLSGLATHYVPSERIAELEDALSHCPSNGVDGRQFARETIDRFAVSASSIQHLSVIHRNAASIRRCFSHMPTVVHILHALEVEAAKDSDAGKWARATLDSLLKFSPTSLALTLEMIHHGRRLTDVGDCLKMEYRLVQRCMEAPDFYEGVRALLVDKDNKPVWKPGHIHDVTPLSTAKYFTPLTQTADEISFH